jgi:hypothetical protein
MPSFMTSYVYKIIPVVFIAYSTGEQAPDLLVARNILIQTITQNVSTEVCVESLSSCWPSLEHKRKVCAFNGRLLI